MTKKNHDGLYFHISLLFVIFSLMGGGSWDKVYFSKECYKSSTGEEAKSQSYWISGLLQ